MTGYVQREQSQGAMPPAAASKGGARSSVQRALVGKSYDEQVQMLSPEGAAKSEAPADEAAPAAAAPEAGAAPEQGGGPTPTATAVSAAEIATSISKDGAGSTGKWIGYGIQCNRMAAAEQVKGGAFDALQAPAAFEAEMAATYANDIAGALATVPPTSQWLVAVLNTYLSASPVGQEVLKSDKGPAKTSDDKSAEITASFIGTLDSFEGALKSNYPAASARAIKELTLRRELFKMFAEHHDKSQAESGIGSAESAVKGKLESHVTSCNAYQGQLLQQAFGKANDASAKSGGGAVDVKQTTTIGWDNKAKKVIIGPKKRNYGLYDTLGRSAKEAGAWTQGGPGLQPKAGDIYVLAKGSSISHIGFFKFAEECPDGAHQIWHTFDGGQPAGTPMTAAGFTQSVRDGALNNVKRAYDKKANTAVVPQPATLAKLRGEGGDEATTKGGHIQLNQDGELRTVAGIIDVGALIALDAVEEEGAAPKK